MKENLRMGNMMVKGHTLGLMEENMLGNGRMGKQNGHGTVTSKDGKYVGEWKGNDFHGQGTRISTNGTKYVGEWKNGKYNGQVTYTSPNGEKYMGEYKNGDEWNGTYYDQNGNIIIKFVNGKSIKQ